MRLTQEQKSLVEKMGVFQERTGKSPVEARIISILLVADQPELTFDDIREQLNISKSATSNALNMLLKTDKIEYIMHTGDRKRYFRSKLQSWEKMAEDNLQAAATTNSLLKEILKQRTTKTTEFNKNLKEVTDFMDYFQKEMLNAFKKWKEKK